MIRIIEKIVAVILLIVFITFLIRHGKIDFSGVDFIANKTKEAVESKEGQEIIDEVKDITVDTTMELITGAKESLTKNAGSNSANSAATSESFSDKLKRRIYEEVLDSLDPEQKENIGIQDALLPATLIRVVDGDTLIVGIDENEIRVRLIGVDTPESVNPDASKNTTYGEVASTYTKSLLQDVDTVYLQLDEELKDQHDRVLAYVWLKGDVNVSNKQDVANYMLNGVLVSDGYAKDKVYPPNVRYADVFTELCEEAVTMKRGLWEDESFAKIWDNTSK